ncbi:thioredoxin family protein [Anaerolineae bacterium CFX9]|jgi:thiol-disulfide isomerase/thioredoxin|nr:thioredoxin family protein [Anaerolineae bacterium CFX9]
MLERLIITLIIVIAAAALWRWYTARQLRRATSAGRNDPLLAGTRHGVSTILYFTTPSCAPCQTVQTPALRRLEEMLGDHVQIVRVDATEMPEDARRWGVLSVPTTFVLNPEGKAVAVNHGVAHTETLLRQITSDRQPA